VKRQARTLAAVNDVHRENTLLVAVVLAKREARDRGVSQSA